MIIVKIYAGLGNQMFQYALYKSLLSCQKEIYTDSTSFIPNHEHEKVNITDIFPNVKLDPAVPTIVNKFVFKVKIINKICRKLNIYKEGYFKEPRFTYNDEVFKLRGEHYLEGFWQTEKYFSNIAAEIRAAFLFPPYSSQINIDMDKTLKFGNSVAIHVRKAAGYYENSRDKTCDVNYYKRAVEYIKQHVQNPEFYVFSDNHEWVKENLTDFEYKVIDWNPSAGPENYLDMQLMASCKHNIIANSSYSWWGAWLNNNKDKIVIGPEKWFSQDGPDFDSSTIIADSWVKL